MASPRWIIALTKSLKDHPGSNVYQLATTDASSTVPRVRTIVHRAIINPSSPATPLLIATTDSRTPKAAQLALAPNIELAWLVVPTQEQFRISGRAYVLPSPENPLAKSFPGSQLGESGFVWEDYRKQVFNELSGHMRASWCRPVPGSKLAGYDEGKKWPETIPRLGEAQTEQEKQLQAKALANFSLLVIDPQQVDFVELSMVPNQRTEFTRRDSEWSEQILVP